MKELLKSVLRDQNRVEFMKQFSTKRHHVDGLIYLCLKRTEDVTIKLYYIPEVVNTFHNFLVHPHNHRYEFTSTILYGEIDHVRFEKTYDTASLKRCQYDWKTRKIIEKERCALKAISVENCKENMSYNVKTNEVHSISIIKPSVIGIVQYQDELIDTDIYCRNLKDVNCVPTKPMTSEQYRYYGEEILRLI